jgi:leader peptidase (prepilin peptidase)/N-methyltransferase
MPPIANYLADATLPAPVAWLLAAWMFALGAAIGSFMNVVVYRLPAGLSLVRPGSHCPKCKTPLAARDNVPIFGWLWLRGRCRYCGEKISPRYPAVELLVACVFLLLACVGPLSGGANLPAGNWRAAGDALAHWMLWGLFAYHAFLMCGLVCAALMELDGHAIGPRLSLPMLFVGWAAPLFWPELRPVPSGLLSSDRLAEFPWAAGLVDGLAGLVAGILAALATWPARRGGLEHRTRPPVDSPLNVGMAMAWTGLFLGWQAVGLISLAMAAAKLVSSLVGRRWRAVARRGWLGCLAPCVLAWIIAWRPIASCLAPSKAAEMAVFVAALAAAAAFSWAIGKSAR